MLLKDFIPYIADLVGAITEKHHLTPEPAPSKKIADPRVKVDNLDPGFVRFQMLRAENPKVVFDVLCEVGGEGDNPKLFIHGDRGYWGHKVEPLAGLLK